MKEEKYNEIKIKLHNRVDWKTTTYHPWIPVQNNLETPLRLAGAEDHGFIVQEEHKGGRYFEHKSTHNFEEFT